MTNDIHTKKVFVVFKESEDYRISPKKFLRHGFGHVFVVMTDNEEVHGNTHKNCIQVDPLFSNMNFYTFLVSEKDLIKAFDIPGYTALELVIEVMEPEFNLMGFKLFTCVSIIKYILGIKCFAITPYQLFKRLLKMQGKQGIVSVKQIKTN